MKLLLTLALLLLVGTADAGEPVTYVCTIIPNVCTCMQGGKIVSCLPSVNHNGDVFLLEGEYQATRDFCLVKMEQAMRDADEYLVTFLSHEQNKIIGLVFTPYGLKEFERKMAIWDTTRENCWKKDTP